MRRLLLVLVVAAVMATMLALAGPSFAAPGSTDPTVDEQLKKVRQATAKYQTPEQAKAAGYEAPERCVAPPNLGGMGYHYVNRKDVYRNLGDGKDIAPGVEGDPLKPEALLYAPNDDGELKLVAVEYIVRDADGDPLTPNDPVPQLFGQTFNGDIANPSLPMAPHEQWMPYHYDLHAWIWKDNSRGVFAQYNPKVRCPPVPPAS
jgi:hypothetical protein